MQIHHLANLFAKSINTYVYDMILCDLKVDDGHRYNMSPLSLSVQCGSDTDDADANNTAHEMAVVPTHRLASRRIWNVATRSWDDDHEDTAKPPVGSFTPEGPSTTPDSIDGFAFLNQNSATGKVMFIGADPADMRSGAALQGSNATALRRFAIGYRNRCSFSESDIQKAAQIHLWRENQNNAAGLHRPTVRNVSIGASNDYRRNTSSDRHTVIGGCYDEKLVSGLRQQLLQSFCRAKSCPEMIVLSNSILHSIHTGLRHCRKMSRFAGRVRQTVPKSSERRRKVKRVIGRHTLAPPLLASWPGRGDIKGSMLAYESSV